MDRVTPPPLPVSSRSKHRRTHSTPGRDSTASSGDETALYSPIAPSTPFSPLATRSNATIPSTPISPPLDGIAYPDRDCNALPVSPDEQSASRPTITREIERSSFEQTSLNGITLTPGTRGRYGLTLDRFSILGRRRSRSSDNAFTTLGYGHTDSDPSSSPSSRANSAACTESSAPSASSDRVAPREGIDANNAQGKLLPEACLFVASLRKDKSERELYRALSDEFSKYGTCYIKVKRNREMPIAFVQYHAKTHADLAMKHAAGTFILDRPCRIEKARAPRCVYVYRRDGSMSGKAEVLHLLGSIGAIDKIWALSETDRERYALAPGFCCRFVFYQDSIDAIMCLCDHPTFHIESFLAPENTNQFVFYRNSVLLQADSSSTIPAFDPNMHLKNALWVGELPSTVTKNEILRIFSSPRRLIAHVDVRIRTIAHASRNASYAIVRFADNLSALDAAMCTHRKLCLATGQPVRIQWAFKHFLHGPIVQSRQQGPFVSRTPKHLAMMPNADLAGCGTAYTGGPSFGRGPHTIPSNAAYLDGYTRFASEQWHSPTGFASPVGHVHAGAVMAQPAYYPPLYHSDFVHGQAYGMYPSSATNPHVTNGTHVASHSVSSTSFAGYPVANGIYSMGPSFFPKM